MLSPYRIQTTSNGAFELGNIRFAQSGTALAAVSITAFERAYITAQTRYGDCGKKFPRFLNAERYWK